MKPDHLADILLDKLKEDSIDCKNLETHWYSPPKRKMQFGL